MFRKMCPSTTSCWFLIMKAAKKCWRPNVAHMQGSGVQIPTCRRFRKVVTRIKVNASQLSYQGVEGYVLLAIYAWFNTKGRLFGPRTPKKLSTETLVPGSLYTVIVVRKDRTIFQPLPFFRGELSNLGCTDIVVFNHCHPCTQEKNESACVVQMFG